MEEESDGDEEIISYDDESKDCCEKISSVLDIIFSIIIILIFILIFSIEKFQIYKPNSNYFENWGNIFIDTLAEIGIKMYCAFWLINLCEFFCIFYPYALVFVAVATIYKYYKRCKFKNLCRKIFEDIKKELKKRESRSISENEIIVKWRAHANLFYSNWLNYIVYQETPYNIESIGLL